MADLEKIAEDLSVLTVIEAAELSKLLEEKWGVSAAAVAVAAGPAAGDDAAEEEEKVDFTLFLASYGEKKINVIKEVRAMTGLGLKEAKTLVESAPTDIREGINKEEAEKLKELLEAVGATVEIK
jgi:large subunit ribosomal protein L7/L12